MKGWKVLLSVGVSLFLVFLMAYNSGLKAALFEKEQVVLNQQSQLNDLKETLKRLELKNSNLQAKNQEVAKQVDILTQNINKLQETLNKISSSGSEKPSRYGVTPSFKLANRGSYDKNQRQETLKLISNGSYQKKLETITYDTEDMASWQSIGRSWVTFYTATVDQTDGDPSTTASGHLSTPAFTVAADPKFYSKGTILYFYGLGFGIVADSGGKIKGTNRFDALTTDTKIAYKLTSYYNVFLVYKP